VLSPGLTCDSVCAEPSLTCASVCATPWPSKLSPLDWPSRPCTWWSEPACTPSTWQWQQQNKKQQQQQQQQSSDNGEKWITAERSMNMRYSKWWCKTWELQNEAWTCAIQSDGAKLQNCRTKREHALFKVMVQNCRTTERSMNMRYSKWWCKTAEPQNEAWTCAIQSDGAKLQNCRTKHEHALFKVMVQNCRTTERSMNMRCLEW